MLDDLQNFRAEARRAIDQGRLADAEAAFGRALHETHVGEQDYASVAAPFADLLERRGDARGALTVRWYLAGRDARELDACARLLPKVPKVDRGRTQLLLGKPLEAAAELENAGQPAAAAVLYEKAEAWAEARALWSRLAADGLRGDAADAKEGAQRARALGSAYERALVQCNLARSAEHEGDERQAHAAVVLAVRLLEEAADHFETMGLRERAFDCFQVLLQLGREHGVFEDVLEGFVNCIRILREDHLKHVALQYLGDAIRVAKERGEAEAAATLALEASQYARAVGQGSLASHYVVVSAELWRDVAHLHLARGDSAEVAENALLAAITAFAETGQLGRVGTLYAELAGLELPESRRLHYARAARRYEGSVNERPPANATPPRPARDPAETEVWHVDLLEWEQAGSAAECCADVMLGRGVPDLVKRRALLGRLAALRLEGPLEDRPLDVVSASTELVLHLARLQIYVALSPLERLWRSPHRAVRLAVLSALQRLQYKRTFVTVREGLADTDPRIVDQARLSMESLSFNHALDPLSRIVRESASAAVRASAIKALSRIDTPDAAEFLFGILAHGSPSDRAAAVASLREARGVSFAALAKEQFASSSPALQGALREASFGV